MVIHYFNRLLLNITNNLLFSLTHVLKYILNYSVNLKLTVYNNGIRPYPYFQQYDSIVYARKIVCATSVCAY